MGERERERERSRACVMRKNWRANNSASSSGNAPGRLAQFRVYLITRQLGSLVAARGKIPSPRFPVTPWKSDATRRDAHACVRACARMRATVTRVARPTRTTVQPTRIGRVIRRNLGRSVPRFFFFFFFSFVLCSFLRPILFAIPYIGFYGIFLEQWFFLVLKINLMWNWEEILNLINFIFISSKLLG